MKANLEKRGLVIIGNGITGISAARVVRKLHPDIRIRIVSKESPVFFSRTALMYIYMGHMRLKDTFPYEPSFFPKNRLELIHSLVEEINVEKKELQLAGQEPIEYDLLLLAMGSAYNKFGWPGQDLPGVQGLYSLQDLEALEKNTTEHETHSAVIVGGGLIGIELAEMLHVRGIHVTFLVREKNYWGSILPQEESAFIKAEIERHKQTLHTNTELKEILPGKDGRVKAVLTSNGDQIPCQFVGLTAGVCPSIDMIKDSSIKTRRGILTDSNMQTNIPDIFAAGDCSEICSAGESSGRVEQLWYTGRMQGSVAGRMIARLAYEKENRLECVRSVSDVPYDRGIWFNSAKFFTLEYQTYGFVPNTLSQGQTFFWQDSKKRQLIRFFWEKETPQSPITGMNFIGTRYRQDICTKWIETKKSAEYAAAHLHEACFDPEFHKQSSLPFQKAFQEKFGTAVVSK